MEPLPPDTTPEAIVGASRNHGALARGSRRYRCGDCNGPTWISPRGQQFVDNQQVPVICSDCFVKRSQKTEIESYMPTREDLERDLGKEKGAAVYELARKAKPEDVL